MYRVNVDYEMLGVTTLICVLWDVLSVAFQRRHVTAPWENRRLCPENLIPKSGCK